MSSRVLSFRKSLRKKASNLADAEDSDVLSSSRRESLADVFFNRQSLAVETRTSTRKNSVFNKDEERMIRMAATPSGSDGSSSLFAPHENRTSTISANSGGTTGSSKDTFSRFSLRRQSSRRSTAANTSGTITPPIGYDAVFAEKINEGDEFEFCNPSVSPLKSDSDYIPFGMMFHISNRNNRFSLDAQDDDWRSCNPYYLYIRLLVNLAFLLHTMQHIFMRVSRIHHFKITTIYFFPFQATIWWLGFTWESNLRINLRNAKVGDGTCIPLNIYFLSQSTRHGQQLRLPASPPISPRNLCRWGLSSSFSVFLLTVNAMRRATNTHPNIYLFTLIIYVTQTSGGVYPVPQLYSSYRPMAWSILFLSCILPPYVLPHNMRCCGNIIPTLWRMVINRESNWIQLNPLESK